MDSELRQSYAACRAITRRAKSSFPLAFLLLPGEKRRAMHALYAFMRVTDDLSDETGHASHKRQQLESWQADLHAALTGNTTSPILPAVADVVKRFAVPIEMLDAVIAGVAMDLEPVQFATFANLQPYLFRVASAVGLACLPVWGLRSGARAADVRESAEAAGYAFQLTNILRDLGEDLDRGRLYLPQDELARFGCPPERWRDSQSLDAFRNLLAFQVERARHFYSQSEPLAKCLSADGRGIFRAMHRTYRDLLEAVALVREQVLTRRVRLSKWRKLRAVATAIPARWSR